MDSDEDLPDLDDEFSNELFPDEMAFDFGTNPVQVGLGFVNYNETTYQQLASDRDDLRQRYQRERRERERLQFKFEQEHDQKVFFEETLSVLSRNISSYEGDLQALRHENRHLKSEFEQLRSSMLTSLSSPSAPMTKVDSDDEHLGQRGTLVASSMDQFGPTSGSSDIYKQEITALAQENELFKQIIDFMDKQEQSKLALEENTSVPSNGKQEWLENVAGIEREKDQLEERIRELERSRDEQEKIIDEIQTKAEDNLRMYKKETKGLESELLSQTSTIDNLEIQLSQMKQLHGMEILTLEERLEAEISKNKDLQTQNSEIERDARRLEEERRGLLIKIEEAYQAETEAIEEKATLEETYARDIAELRRTMEEEVQAKTNLSVEIERLMAEVVESEKIRKDMEARFLQETQDLKVRFPKEQEVSSNIKDTAVNHVVVHTKSTQQAHLGSQRLSGETVMLTKDEDWKVKLNEEVRRREALEEENKKLLYQINDILEQNASGGAIVKAKAEDDSVSSQFGKIGHCTGNSQKGQDLEAEIDDLKERCRVLEKDARKKKELEIENADLCEEIEELSSKKNEMARKQKELMRELENSLSSMTQIEDKNRRLTEETNTLSGKIRQMEYNFKNEKEDLMRSYTKDNSLQINELLTEKESMERKYNEQVKRGKNLEANIDSLETRIRELERTNERLERMRSEATNRLTEELNFERVRVATLKDDLEKSVEAFQRQTEQLKATLYENKRRYEEELKKLEEEKHRIRGDLLKEKETYKRLFEEERQSLERRINEVQTKFGQRNATPDHDEFARKSAESYNSGNNESVSNDTVRSPSMNLSTEAISDLKKEVDILKTKNKELRERLKDTERKYLREIEDLEHNSTQNMMKVKREIEEDSRRKKDPFEKQSTQLKKVDSKEKSAVLEDEVIEQGSFPGKNSFEHVDDLIKFHNEQMDELKGHVRLQLESFENEKQNFQRQLQEERQTTLRNKMKESSLLQNTVKKLTEEVKRLRQEKEILGNKLKKSSGNNKRWANELTEKVAKISNECERLRREKDDAQKSVCDLTRKLNSAEVRIYDIEKKHHEEIHQLEVKFDFKKKELDQSIATAETKLRDGMRIEYKVLLNKEKGKHEDTMNALRKEIVSLQEQRHQLQTKLTSTQRRSSQASYNLIMKKTSSSGQSFNKSSLGTDSMLFGLRQMEGKLRDLEREVETLKREKTEIKVRFRQEKIQIQSECDQQIVRLEEKYRKQIEGLKRRLREATMQVQSSALSAKRERSPRSSPYSSKTTDLLFDQDFTADGVSGPLESEMSMLKDRMDDIERRTRSFEVKNWKTTANVRFPSSPKRGRDQRRTLRRLSSSMQELNSTPHLSSGPFVNSSGAPSSESVVSKARSRASFLSQSQGDLRLIGKDSGSRDDHLLKIGHWGSSFVTHGNQEIITPQIQSLFRGSTSNGFDASKNRGIVPSRNSFQSDQYFVPSIRIEGGFSQERKSGSGGLSIGHKSTSEVRRLYSDSGVQQVLIGPQLNGHSCLNSSEYRVQGRSDASVGIVHAKNSQWKRPNQATSTEASYQSHSGTTAVLHRDQVSSDVVGKSELNRPIVSVSTRDLGKSVLSDRKPETIAIIGTGSGETQANALGFNSQISESENLLSYELDGRFTQQNNSDGPTAATHIINEEPTTEQSDSLVSAPGKSLSEDVTDSTKA